MKTAKGERTLSKLTPYTANITVRADRFLLLASLNGETGLVIHRCFAFSRNLEGHLASDLAKLLKMAVAEPMKELVQLDGPFAAIKREPRPGRGSLVLQ